jgi:hypothetical protein
MALRQFWTSICSAARFLVPAVIADAPKFDVSDIEAGLRHTRDWLTPESVEGFDEHDFGFLPDDSRRRLAQCVNEFRAIAQQVAADEQATDEQLEAALPSLLGVLEVMRPDRYADLDALVIGKRVERELAGRLIVEAGVRYVKQNALQGRSEELTCWEDYPPLAIRWRDELANVRVHQSTKQRPVDRFQEERDLLRPLPVTAFDTDQVVSVVVSSHARVLEQGLEVARHARCYDRGPLLCEPTHQLEALKLRQRMRATRLALHPFSR